MNRVHNFSAGPAVLPLEVLQEVQKDLVDYKGSGLSVMEMSHRSPEYQAIIDNANAGFKKLMKLDDDYEVLFLQGGASTQFYMLPLNLAVDGKVANYVDTGTWAGKSYKEAKKIGKKVHLAASSKDKNYNYIPKKLDISSDAGYLHICTNNTISGTEYFHTPKVDIPLFADMSSDFLSREMDYNKYSLIYAGAQKNVGPAGCCVLIIRKSLMEKANTDLPTMMDYRTHIDKGSMFNTPPTFTIYVIGLVLKWIESKGGLKAIEENNKKKANIIYNKIDSTDFYNGPVAKEDRSLMNIPFTLSNKDLEAKFLSEAKEAKMFNLKGHRSVGGCRASIYNAMPNSSIEFLVDFMDKFEKENK